MSKQTAVDYLLHALHASGFIEDITDPLLIQRVNEAKKIEREQHSKTYNQGLNSNFQKFQHYYEQTYGNEASDES